MVQYIDNTFGFMVHTFFLSASGSGAGGGWRNLGRGEGAAQAGVERTPGPAAGEGAQGQRYYVKEQRRIEQRLMGPRSNASKITANRRK